jgi:hypothetical protein
VSFLSLNILSVFKELLLDKTYAPLYIKENSFLNSFDEIETGRAYINQLLGILSRTLYLRNKIERARDEQLPVLRDA